MLKKRIILGGCVISCRTNSTVSVKVIHVSSGIAWSEKYRLFWWLLRLKKMILPNSTRRLCCFIEPIVHSSSFGVIKSKIPIEFFLFNIRTKSSISSSIRSYPNLHWSFSCQHYKRKKSVTFFSKSSSNVESVCFINRIQFFLRLCQALFFLPQSIRLFKSCDIIFGRR